MSVSLVFSYSRRLGTMLKRVIQRQEAPSQILGNKLFVLIFFIYPWPYQVNISFMADIRFNLKECKLEVLGYRLNFEICILCELDY